MNSGVPSRVIAACFALTGFAVALLAGLSAGNSATRILGAALVSLLFCHIVGIAIGLIGQRVVNEHLHKYREGNPLPDFKRGAPERAQGGAGVQARA